MKNSEIINSRKSVAKKIDEFYYEPRNDARCHKQGYKRFGKYICAVSYQTYMRYLKAAIPDGYELPAHIVNGIRCLILLSDKYPFLLEDNELTEFMEDAKRTVKI